MIGLTSLEVQNSVFIVNTTISKYEFHTDNFDEFLFEELKGELEEIPDNSNISQEHL